LAASQMDWQATQQNHAEQWLASVHKVFQSFDTDADGVIAYEQIVECLRSKLPSSEVHSFALMSAQLLQCCDCSFTTPDSQDMICACLHANYGPLDML